MIRPSDPPLSTCALVRGRFSVSSWVAEGLSRRTAAGQVSSGDLLDDCAAMGDGVPLRREGEDVGASARDSVNLPFGWPRCMGGAGEHVYGTPAHLRRRPTTYTLCGCRSCYSVHYSRPSHCFGCLRPENAHASESLRTPSRTRLTCRAGKSQLSAMPPRRVRQDGLRHRGRPASPPSIE